MNKLNGHVVALSLGVTTTVLYIICVLVISALPLSVAVNVVNSLQHSIDFSSVMAKNATVSGILIGIVGWFFIAAATGYIFAFIYNRIGEKFAE